MNPAFNEKLDHDERLVLNLNLAEFHPRTAYERFLIGCLVSLIFLERGECRSRPKFGYYTGVSRERIRQIEERGLRKLRNWGSLNHYKIR